jgi:hypothetical protein
VGEARGAEQLPHLGRQGHHGTAQHQGSEQAAPLRPGPLDQGGGQVSAQIGDGRGRPLQHLPLQHLELAGGLLLAQSLGRAGEQRVGSRLRLAQAAPDPQLPALLGSGVGAGTELQFRAAHRQLQQGSAAAAVHAGTGISQQPPLQRNLRRRRGRGQQAGGIPGRQRQGLQADHSGPQQRQGEHNRPDHAADHPMPPHWPNSALVAGLPPTANPAARP